jgi:hypothetical protein
MFTLDCAPSKRVSLNLAVGTTICPVASIGNYQAEEPDFGQTRRTSLVISLREGATGDVTVTSATALATQSDVSISGGDRFQFLDSAATTLRTATASAVANGLPKALFNASRSVPATTLSTAIAQAFTDKNLALAGNQALATGQEIRHWQRVRR